MTKNTLHLVRCSAFNNNKLVNCLANLSSGDKVLFIDDGCYNLNHPIVDDISATISIADIYVLDKHMIARAIENNLNINSVSYQGFTQLIINQHNVITWQ